MDTLFFWISKLIWLLVSPGSLLYLLIILSFIFFYLNKQKLLKIFFSISCIYISIIAFIPVGEWLLYPLESRFKVNPELPEKVDGIIVLSGAENPLMSNLWQQVEVNGAAERDLAFMSLARKYPDVKLIFTGGSGSMINQGHKGADIAKQLFTEQGLDTSKIIFEKNSRNTYENAIYSKALVKPAEGENWLLITTSWHMPRSVGIFCQLNWHVIPYPVDHTTLKNNLLRVNYDLSSNLNGLEIGIKEWLGLIAYRASGKTDALLPAGCR